MEQRKGAESKDAGGEKWVYDSSTDHKGQVPLRASTGVWKASRFIIGWSGRWRGPLQHFECECFPYNNGQPISFYRSNAVAIEFSERLSYFGIATSLVLYLSKVMHQDLKTAARNVNYWSGVTTLMPLLGGFIADAYLGRFSTVLMSTIIYLMGLILLTMSWFVPALKACENEICTEPRKVHEVVFFLGIYLISVGTGGHKPSLESFGADQFDEDHHEERKQKMSYFNWWNFALCSGLLFGVTVVVYVQDHVNWGASYIILTAVMAVSLVIFVTGRRCYRYRGATGSPLTPLLQVLVAAIRKRNLPYPSSPDQLYEVPKTEKTQGRLLCHTNKLKFLDKAAVFEDKNNPTAEKQNLWRLATVTKVEELKLVLNVIPIWLATLPFGICVAQGTTFFIKQSVTMNRKIGHGFVIPPASIFGIAAIGMIISVTIYEKFVVPMLRNTTGNERGLNLLRRIGIGMSFTMATMVVAALVEKKRLGVVENDPKKGAGSMSVFWLAPQYLIVGFGDGFALVGLQEYFYDQVPDSMRSLGIALYLSVIGASNFLSSWLITVVDKVTTPSTGGHGWFGKDLNSSRLDKFYWLLAAISSLNMFVYVFLARRYTYKNVQRMAVADCHEGDGDAVV